MSAIGTEWTAPGSGATIVEIWDAAEGYLVVAHANDLTRSAFKNLGGLIKKQGQDYRTNLALNGGPVTAHDLSRIAVCE